MHHFLDGILKISERSVEPACSVERETYVRQEAKVLSLDGTESEELVPDRSLHTIYVLSSACYLVYIFK